ncbi:MAG: hypothetical protein Kapaf2KO_01920 [Candidatus Kapaibacteriales bacterium]
MDTQNSKGDVYAFIISEGLLGKDQAMITAVNSDYEVIDGYFSNSDGGEVLGDNATDAKISNDTLFVLLSGSAALVLVDIETGNELGAIQFPEGATPRHFDFWEEKLYVTDLYKDIIWEVNLINNDIRVFAQTGPSPEAIVIVGGQAYVANTGLGQLRMDEENASTIAIIDMASGATDYVESGVNVESLVVSSDGSKLYAGYLSFWWIDEGSTNENPVNQGGIIEYSLPDMRPLRSWKSTPLSMEITQDGREIYLMNSDGLSKIAPFSPNEVVEVVKENPLSNEVGGDKWYGLGVDNSRGDIWICNGMDYSRPGEILVVSAGNGSVISRVPTGYLPNKVLFP